MVNKEIEKAEKELLEKSFKPKEGSYLDILKEKREKLIKNLEYFKAPEMEQVD